MIGAGAIGQIYDGMPFDTSKVLVEKVSREWVTPAEE